MSHLFDPFVLRGAVLRNRIGVSPMCQYSCKDGFATDWHLVHLGARAVGGAGLIIVEATAVEPRGRISPGDLGLWKDEHIEPLARVTRFLKEHGAVPAIQIAHAGRKAGTAPPWEGGHPLSDEDGGWNPVGPSAVAFSDRHRLPHALTVEEIKRIQQCFVDAALRAVEAGFRLIEIHGAHGYLLHSFYSPLGNRRTDAYGGEFANRVRFLVETAQQVRAALPDDIALAVRISATDWHEGGWTLDDSVKLALDLKASGVDLVDCSSGGIQPDIKAPDGAGYQVPLAETVKHRVGIPTAAVGNITQAMQADAIVRNGRADVVLLGREMLRQPYWPIQAAAMLGQLNRTLIPVQYHRAY
jgi:2,4-dienoyl-CoA reductase-like NADH-dependent reductase (Old Yellow Enzyme family)